MVSYDKMRGIIILLLLLAGCASSVEQPAIPDQEVNSMKISSTAFEHDGIIPSKYTCDGEDINPPLKIDDIPKGTKTMALIVDDPDAPVGTWDHWIVWNIPPTPHIGEHSIPGLQGTNDFKKLPYGGPCPPSGTHRYFFKIYALDAELSLQEGADKDDLESAMKGHVLGQAELIGKYSR